MLLDCNSIMTKAKNTFNASSYGGVGWSPRTKSHNEDIGRIWLDCGIGNEWATLKSVVLHRPGEELAASADSPGSVLMLDSVDVARAQDEHDQLARNYEDNGVEVHYLDPEQATPNLMFCADLVAMTPHGAVLARPASTIRAGEERSMAQYLAGIGVPILRTLTGSAIFEGADLAWVDPEQAILGVGLRTNREAAAQIETLLAELGTDLLTVDLPFGTMHFMGMLRIVDQDLAIAWPRRTPHAAVMLLRERGFQVHFPDDMTELEDRKAFNFVTLGPRRILMGDDSPKTRKYFEKLGIECICTPILELRKAAGAMGCLTGILHREYKTDYGEQP